MNAELAQRWPTPSGCVGGIAGLVPCFAFLAARSQAINQHRSLGVVQSVNRGMAFHAASVTAIAVLESFALSFPA
ncbi:hypothetical protein [Pseudomonas sp. CCC2.2]|uniref:hypothetical protein n=1 Tax=Pseudomonas sp. CCC2.2 TaxID=3048605 RepID=UPI002B22FE26|nr:hypothetical protein [Pseudomonas sp. CCC2.2]MEB0150563.1 hypothetical protein [Pseudomonas sp. CCC2.2]